MPDYEPLDLTQFCNVGTAFYGESTKPQIGEQSFYGLPFTIASERDVDRCFIGLNGEGSNDAITIPIGRTARYLIFAHALLESRPEEGFCVGREVASYIVQLAGGQNHRLSIRNRFEVAEVPTRWGDGPFLALPDQKDELMPRYHGEWHHSGHRQAEAVQGKPTGYYLWAWHNPDQNEIESVTVEPSDRKFVLAAITLGHLEEHPLRKVAKREVKIELTDQKDSQKPFNLEVEVDRGVATFPFALPTQSANEFVKDTHKGWGEARNQTSSPAYVEIAARPSAIVTIKSQGETIADVNWGQLQQKKKITSPRVKVELLDRGRNWVHVTVVDDQTDKPIPCRVHFRSPEGIPYQPHGHHNQVNRNVDSWHQDIGGDLDLGQVAYAYIDGKCQGWLPRGTVVADIARGFEYEPLRTEVTIAPGQRELQLRLKRWTDMNQQRWFSGDSHVHFLGGQGAHREAQGEDLNVVNLLQSQWGHLFTNTEDFIGRPTVSDDGNTIVYCSQENRQHLLGHLTLLGLKEPVMPWCSDGPSEAELGSNLEITMARWADACHAQGGTVIIPHLPAPNGEPATLIATGRADAVEMLAQDDYFHLEYYRYLNCGYRLPLVGGTDKMSSSVPVGMYRTYAYIPGDRPFDYQSWCDAVKAGRTFLSSGPMIQMTVNGARIGDTVNLPGNGGTIEVEASAQSIFPMHTLQIVQEGRVVASSDESGGTRSLRLHTKLKIDGHTWLAARCGGPNYSLVAHHDCSGRGIFAHTSPVYLAVGGDWWMFDAETAQYMLTLVNGTLDYVRQTAPHHEHDDVTHHHGHADHMAYLEEPFHQAAEAIHKRMHQLGIPH